MFTGIVQGTGRIKAIDIHEHHRTLTIELPDATTLATGGSVAIDGVCLTAVDIDMNIVKFDVIEETLLRTTLGIKEVDSLVNVERSLKFGDEIGGHLLSGHIMDTGTVLDIQSSDTTMNVLIATPPSVQPYIVEKGYVAINGVSLTIGAVESDTFWLHLIPETLRLTTCDSFEVGQTLNIEIDSTTQVIVETVRRFMEK